MNLVAKVFVGRLVVGGQKDGYEYKWRFQSKYECRYWI